MALAVLAVPLGWVAYSLNWIRQRREVIRTTDFFQRGPIPKVDAPAALWFFGEEGVYSIPRNTPKSVKHLTVGELQELFPESEIWDRSENGELITYGPIIVRPRKPANPLR